jgi:hypothetical protein
MESKKRINLLKGHSSFSKKSILSLILIFTGFFATLWANQIEAIQIDGLKRTKEKTVLEIIDVEPGDQVTPELRAIVEQKLRKAGIFQEDLTVTLLPGEEGDILSITLYDMWTLVGLPYMGSSEGSLYGGAVLMDTNLGGRANNITTAVYFDQAGSWYGAAYYEDPTLFDTSLIGSVLLTGGRVTTSYSSLDGEELWEDYYTEYFTGGLGIGGKINDSLTLSFSTAVDLWVDSSDELTPPSSGENHGNILLTSQVVYDGTEIFPLFQEGVSGGLYGTFVGDLTELSSSLIFNANVSSSWVFNSLFLLKLSGGAGMTNNDFHYLFALGDDTGSYTLPDDQIATDRYINGELKGEIRLAKMDFGYITVPVYYEAGYLNDYYDDSQFYHGVGGGVRFYLSKVAIPAMGLDYTYNITTEEGGLDFFLGFSL